MKNTWMIRAGGQGRALGLFEEEQCAGVDYGVAVSLKGLNRDQIQQICEQAFPSYTAQKLFGMAVMLSKIVFEIEIGDEVVTYDPAERCYWQGEITGGYSYAGDDASMPHRRTVLWQEKRAERDLLKQASKNSLGSTLTVFRIRPEISEDLKRVMAGEEAPPAVPDDEIESREVETAFTDPLELLKDRILQLSPEEMENLLAALLRAMGFKAFVSARGKDRGLDVFASPDGLGLQEPRIKAEVKHRPKTKIGAPDIRCFLGSLRQGDRGIYLSTGGFGHEAKYEADRATVPITLLDLDSLAKMVAENYEAFDVEGRVLLPLRRIYLPSD